MPSILVIDDEADVRDGIKRVLDRAGFSVRVLGNATDAMVELKRVPTDVVITDIIMPKVNGVDTIDRIRREFPAVRIVAISGGGNFEVTGNQPVAITTSAYLTAAKQAGADMILKKPFESAELLQAVVKVLDACR